jgi:hypothetical protein
VRIEGVPDDISHLDIEGEFRELQGEFNLSIFKEPVEVKNGKLKVEGNTISAENFIVMVGEDRLKLEGEMQGFKYPQIEYSVEGEMLNLEENLVDGFGRGKGSKPDEYTTSLKGEYDIGTVKLWGITAKDFKAQTVYKDGIVKFDRLQFRAYGGEVDGTASILIPERSYTFSIMADDIDIGRYLTDNTDYKDVVVGGRLDVDIMFSGKGITKDDAKEYLRGEGIVVFRDGLITKLTVLNRLAGWSHITVLKDIFVKRLDAGFVIGDGGIFIRDLEITSKDIKKGFVKGKVNFDETLDVYGEIRLTRDATEKFKERAITLSLDKDGCGAFAFRLTGKTTAPSYQLDVERTGQLAEDNVGGLSVFEKEYFGN